MVSDEDTRKVMSLLALGIVLKFYFTIMAAAKGNVRAPEDKKAEVTVDENTQLKDGGAGFDDKERFRRIGMNELENVPITLALMAYSVFQPFTSNEVNIAMGSIFLFGRIMQSVNYSIFPIWLKF